MTSRRVPSLLCCLALVLAACGGPAAVESSDSATTTARADSATTTPTASPSTTTLVTTTTQLETTTTTRPSLESTTTIGSPPDLELKPPGAFSFPAADELDQYYIFVFDVGAESVTTRFDVRDTTNEVFPPQTITIGAEGERLHIVWEEAPGSFEFVSDGAESWGREPGGEWEEVPEGLGESSVWGYYLTNPDWAYTMAYAAFDQLQFAGWTEVDGQRLASYRGGDEAVQAGVEAMGESDTTDVGGSFEALWSPDEYFATVRLDVAMPEGSFTMTWDVFDVGSTIVELPG